MVTSLVPIEITAALVGVVGTVAGVVIALFWRKIGNWHKKRAFEKLILRELEEFVPYSDPSQVQSKKWTTYLEKENTQFVHRDIITKPDGNLEFVLSLDADLVYYVSQLWFEVEKKEAANRTLFMYFWCEIDKYCKKRRGSNFFMRYSRFDKIKDARIEWENIVGLKYDLNCENKSNII
jgi:hypothetical protein